MYFNEKAETMSQDELKNLQSQRLKEMVTRTYQNSPFYKKKMDEAGVHPDDIKSIDDLSKLPYTVKQDLRDTYPLGMLSVPNTDLVRIHASSGTTGKPTVVAYTKNDIEVWAESAARALCCAEADKDSIVQVAYGYGLFTGGLGLHYGVEYLGATAVPMSGGNTEKQLLLMRDLGSTHLACTPSYAMNLGEALSKTELGLEGIKLKGGIFGAEPWSQNLREKIEEKLGITALDIYGLSEIMGPGVAMECKNKQGLHIWEDHFAAEIIDPDTLEVLEDGQEGELVITTITKEGLPLIRYRTRDLSTISREPCACGRTHARIARVKARSDDMLIIRGVNVFPSQIESVILGVEGVDPHYEIIVSREGIMDVLEIRIELSANYEIDKISSLELLAKTLTNRLESVLGISSKIRLVESGSIQRFEGKAKRVTDMRKE